MKYQEPYFMKQLHKQRERDARELYHVFNGDFNKWWNYKMKKVKQGLLGENFSFKKEAPSSLLRDKSKKDYKAGKGVSRRALDI